MGGKAAPAILVETKEMPQKKTQAIRAIKAFDLSVICRSFVVGFGAEEDAF
jgi:hypothetical protein